MEEEEEEPKLELDEIIRLVSAENEVFYLEKCYAFMSKNIEAGLGCTSMESLTKEFHFPHIRSEVLEKVIQYLHYKYKYQQLLDRDMISMSQVPQFDLPSELALDVLIAASYLQC